MQRQFFALWTVRGVSWSKRELEGSIYGLSNWHFKVAPSCFLCLSLWTFLHVSLSLILGSWFKSDDRKAEPLERLERAKVLFLDRLSYRINASSLQKVCILTQGKKLCFLRFFFWFSFIHMYHRLGKWLEIHKLKFRRNLLCSAIFFVVGISVHILLDTEEYLVPQYNRSASLLNAMPNCLCEWVYC